MRSITFAETGVGVVTKAAIRGCLAVLLAAVLTVSGQLIASSEAEAGPEIGECVTATNWEHVLAGRAYTWLGLWVLTGTGGVYLGLIWDTRSLMQTGPNTWSPNSACGLGS
jgi:hypothetical protein